MLLATVGQLLLGGQMSMPAQHQFRLVFMPLPCPAHLQVYPLPFIDRISEEPHDQEWDAVWLENEHVRLMVLPQLGGRIHVMQVRGACCNIH